MLDPKVFKAYDVRGIYPDELDEEGAYAIGRAYVEQFAPRSVAVGRDMRVSSPSMAAAVRDGAADGGAEVLELGMVGTEMVYFAVGELGLDGGIAVTASHNPKQYTGMKIVRAGALPVGGESGLLDVRSADRVCPVLVQLLRVEAANVVRLESSRVQHDAQPNYAARISRMRSVDSASGDSEMTVAGRSNRPSASRSGSARSVPSPYGRCLVSLRFAYWMSEKWMWNG